MALPEVWLRGPLPHLSPLLQPVAHALLQASEEVVSLMQDFPDPLLWEQVAGMASPAFHLQHLTGVIQRLFTYARGQGLTEDQLLYLRMEGKPNPDITAAQLVAAFTRQVQESIEELSNLGEEDLTAFRGVGRAQLPSTILGLYVHAAEHTMRHLGQLLVTVKVLRTQQTI